ncbi:hypothetical protein C4D60_Mb01t18810 [Musa balbisiana]|uniref:DNA-directed RNA polymerase n=1 Tax=Musa balbisiana TaxID=52838 RepID=A0A4S8JNK2_MUSBA|nr:hypothetical protein C4D60_Mb01t18810 [Musa balbisiana]
MSRQKPSENSVLHLPFPSCLTSTRPRPVPGCCVPLSALRSYPFPLRSEPQEPEDSFPVVFSQISPLQSPLLLDPDDVVDDDAAGYLNGAYNSSWLGRGIALDFPGEAVKRVICEEPAWIPPGYSVELVADCHVGSLEFRRAERRKYNSLRRRQIKAETEAWERAAQEYKELEREMLEKKLAPSLPYVKSLFLGWFEPLRDAIERDQRLQKTKMQKAAYAPHIGLLPADKMAVIVMHKMMGLLMVGQEEGCIRLVQAAIRIGEAIEQEFKIQAYLEKSKRPRRRKNEGDQNVILCKQQEISRKKVMKLIKMKKLIEVQKLLRNEIEMESWGRDGHAKLGSRLIELLLESAFVQVPCDSLADCPPEILPAFRHTFKNISKENGKSFNRYGVIECDPLVHKGFDSTARHMVIPYLPMLIPPKSWKGYDNGGHLFLPSYVMRTHGAQEQQKAIKSVPRKQLQKALDTLGRTKWRINRRILDVIEIVWSRGGGIAGLVDRKDIQLPDRPETEDLTEIKKWRWSTRKAKRLIARCMLNVVAHKMRDEEGFYYPHNIDFRGRAYPMHSHLNHLSSDLCRGILEFAEGKPLGKSGLHWLKIHLANIYGGGVEKLSYDRRLTFVKNHLRDIFDSAENPIDGNRWWISAEDPFQCLAASLGRDSLEAAAVNLVAGEKPADVYSEIAIRVREIMRKDSEKDPTLDPTALLAKVLVDQVDRKLVKQTVMTSVYGVTYVGAREQIKRRLEEKGLITDDRLLFGASCYAAKVTLNALGEMFEAARGIMKWLGDCAKIIASENEPVKWTTPLGLPVVQPYRNSERHQIRTSLQVLTLQREGQSVSVKRQKTAFPPNFVHSLDGSHMMMTAISCKNAGLHFAGVHDSFWTHACDVDRMNQILREEFVALYNIPILENLLDGFQTSFPTLTFPPLPDRGDFDLKKVLESPYFFN